MAKGLQVSLDTIAKFNKSANDHHLRYGRMLETAIDCSESKEAYVILRDFFDIVHGYHLEKSNESSVEP